MKNPDNRRSLVFFTWHSKKNIALIEPLIEFLASVCDFKCYVLTSQPSGKLILLENHHDAFTVNELLLAYCNEGGTSLSPEPDKNSCPLDLYLDWLYTPKDPVLLPAPSRTSTKAYYNWKRQQLIKAYTGFLQDVDAFSVITWNGSLLVTGALAEAAGLLGIPAFYMERGLLPGSLVIDAEGVNNQSSIAGSDWQNNSATRPDRTEEDALRAYCGRLGSSGASIVTAGEKKDREAVMNQLALTRQNPVVLLPLQIESDSNIQNNSPFFKSMEDLIESVSTVLAGTKVQLVVKPHPEDQSRRDKIERLCGGSNVRCCWDLSLQSLLPVTDLVVVINSTVGLEALLQNKPVVALGRSIYDRKGFTADLNDKSELESLIQGTLQALWEPHENPDFWWFLKTLIRNHTFFYQDPPGLVDIKPDLCETLMGKGTKPVPRGPGKLQNISAANDILTELMQGKVRGPTVVIGPLGTVMDEIPDQVSVLNRQASPLTFLKVLFQRHDLMVCMEWPSNRVLRAFFSLIRARKKVILG